jgi:hypothetical protein
MTALVKNPVRRNFSITGGKVMTKRNPTSKITKTGKKAVFAKRKPRQNPAPKVVYRYKAKQNPINTVFGLFSAAVVAGLSVTVFDFLTSKTLPTSVGAPVRIIAKGGIGFGIAKWGNRLPVIGEFSKEIGLVLITLAVVDGVQSYVLPIVRGVAGNLSGGTGEKKRRVVEDAEMGDDYYYGENTDEDSGENENEFGYLDESEVYDDDYEYAY